MRLKRLYLCAILIGLTVIAASGSAYGITVDEAIERLKTHKFGENNDVLDFLHESAVGSYSNPALRKKLNDGFTRILESGAEYDAKQFVCRQLALTATAEHIPVLARHLTDAKMSHIALYALRHIDSGEVDKALLSALDKASGRAKLGIISTLGNRRSAAAIEALGKLMISSADEEIAIGAIRALGRIGTESARSQFMSYDIIYDPPKKLSYAETMAFAHANLDFADRFLADGNTKQAERVYRFMFDVHNPGYIRAAALRGLAEVMGDKAKGYVAEALKSNDEDLYGMAAVIVRNTASKSGAEAMAGGIGSLRPEVQGLLIKALAGRSDGAGVNIIEDQCKSRSVPVRITALGALGRVGDETCVGLLVKHAAQGTGGERAAAMNSLEVLKSTKVNAALTEQLELGDNQSKAVICEALLGRSAVEAAPALVKAAKINDRLVRAESLKALRDLAGKDEIPALVDLIFIVEPAQADQVGKALAAVARRNSVYRECTETILAKHDQAKKVEQRAAILTTLGGLGHDLALPVLREGLQDSSGEIRYAAIKALSVWPNAAVAEDLAKVVQSTNNRTHRVLALRGYIDLIDASVLPADGKLEHYVQAMQLAREDAQKKKVLSVLAGVETVGAFEMAMSRLGDSSLKNEAALAACAIAQKIYAAKGRAIKGGLERIVDSDLGETVRQQAWGMLQSISKLKNYLTDWEVSGPYVVEGKNHAALFDMVFAPEVDGGKDAKWRKMPAGEDAAQPYYLDLLKTLNGGEQRVAYLRTKLQWPREQQVTLVIGSDDGSKIWLNGKVVHSNNVARPFTVDQDTATATLKKGENSILMKITQNNLPWGASLRIEEPTPPKPPKLGKGFRLHVINGDSAFEAACAADINKDGKLDIFCGGFWYEAPAWKKHFVREAPVQGEYYNDFANLPMDVDGDGWTDIVNAAFFNKRLFWIRNPGKSTGGFETIDIDHPGNMETAIAADINGDGQQDVVPNIGGSAAWYEFKRDASAKHGVKWVKHELPKEIAAHGVGAGDVNGDGRCDVVAPGGWAEQKANGTWQWHADFNLGATSIPILVYDVDGDKDGDIIWGMGHDYGIFWLEQVGRSWTRHEIDHSWSQPHFLVLADLDNDGNDEVVTGKRYHAHNGHDPGGNDPLCVYYYSFEKEGKKWTRHLLHEGGEVGLGINTQAVDMDGDGDIDIVAPGKSGLYLFENLLVQ